MNTHQVTLNGQPVVIGRGDFRLLTMVRSIEHHDGNGKKVTAHELAVEAVDAFNKVATAFIPPRQLNKGDVIQILIGEANDA
jgi:hypothetical protein